MIVACIFLLGIGFGLILSKATTKSPPVKPVEITQEATSAGIIAGAEREKMSVKRVVDGDTIELADGRKVRYIGIDTPETVDPRKPVQCFGREAATKNRELVENKEVELEKDLSDTDRYGRLLRYVYVGDLMVNEELVKMGFAQSSTFPPDIKYQERFVDAEKLARKENRGLWVSCMMSPTPGAVTASPTQTTILGETTQTAPSVQPSASVFQTTNFTSDTGCVIKGNISSGGKIYHLAGCGSYEKTVIDETAGEKWFCTEEEAVQAGWRKAKNC